MTTAAGVNRLTGNTLNIFKVSGILLILLGVAAICLPAYAGLSIAVMVGVLLSIAGAALLASALFVEPLGHKVLRLLAGAVTFIAGSYLAIHPGITLESLTLWLAVSFAAEGITEVVAYFAHTQRSAAVLLNGLLSLLLAVMIGEGWPSSSLWAIGTLFGVKLILTGVTRLAVVEQTKAFIH